MRFSKKLSAGALIVALMFGVTAGCASVEVSPPVSSCHAYKASSAYGRFTIQQSAKGKALQWGAYPNATYSGTWYVVNVYVNGKRYDGKGQNYAPHGSISAATAAKNSGKILKISGTVSKSKKTVLVYNMQCKIM